MSHRIVWFEYVLANGGDGTAAGLRVLRSKVARRHKLWRWIKAKVTQ